MAELQEQDDLGKAVFHRAEVIETQDQAMDRQGHDNCDQGDVQQGKLLSQQLLRRGFEARLGHCFS